MIYSAMNVPKDTPVWGFAYDTNTSKETMAVKKEPILGMVKEERGRYYFYEFKTNGKDLKSSRVRATSRTYSDNRDEAIAEYNKHIGFSIDRAKKLIEQYQKDLI